MRRREFIVQRVEEKLGHFHTQTAFQNVVLQGFSRVNINTLYTILNNYVLIIKLEVYL